MDDNLFSQPPGEASFVAIGDSFTEGLNDAAPGGGYRGWADRLAGLIAVEHPGLRYANLAVRGKLIRQIVADQVPAAIAMSPGLVSLAAAATTSSARAAIRTRWPRSSTVPSPGSAPPAPGCSCSPGPTWSGFR